EAYKIKHIISTVQRTLYASRACGGGLPMGLQISSKEIRHSALIPREDLKTNGLSSFKMDQDNK
ncbi:Hypothetical protein FKW44_003397, partial [Caligus rogercresseyi]